MWQRTHNFSCVDSLELIRGHGTIEDKNLTPPHFPSPRVFPCLVVGALCTATLLGGGGVGGGVGGGQGG